MAKSTNSIFLSNSVASIGTVIDKRIEPKDTYLVSHTVIKKTSAAMAIAFGSKIISTPQVVATPFPPLNFKNMLQLCPITALNPSNALKTLKVIGASGVNLREE